MFCEETVCFHGLEVYTLHETPSSLNDLFWNLVKLTVETTFLCRVTVHLLGQQG